MKLRQSLHLGAAWTLGAMALFDMDFNLANLFAVPIIIGMGVDNGVNMLYRFREEAILFPLPSDRLSSGLHPA